MNFKNVVKKKILIFYSNKHIVEQYLKLGIIKFDDLLRMDRYNTTLQIRALSGRDC